jgi:GNAT superfamily N-acetyltransferase
MAGGCEGGCSVNQPAIVRSGTDNDLRAVGLLWRKLNEFHHSIGMKFAADDNSTDEWIASFSRTLGKYSFLWVAEQGTELSAFILCRIKKIPAYLGGMLVGEISDLYVSEALRGQGTGRLLVNMAMQYFKTQNVHSVEVQILARNESGLAFWNSLGFLQDVVLVRRMIEPDSENA